MVFVGLLLLAAMQTTPPLADIPTDEIIRWADCLSVQAVERDRASMTPEEVVDAAFAACRAEEQAVETAERRVGSVADLADRMEGSRVGFRNGLLFRIQESRGLATTGDTTTDRAAEWGACLSRRAIERAHGPESADAIADTVFGDCAEQEQRVRAVASAVFTPSEADALVALFRERARAQILQDIAGARAGR